MSLTRTRPTNPVRAALEQAMVSPRVQSAVALFVNALVDEGEAILRARYAGETLRMYTPKRGSAEARDSRDLRIEAALAAGEPAAMVAGREGLSVRRVEQIAQRCRARQKAAAAAARAKSSA
jgi:hypothetical protein